VLNVSYLAFTPRIIRGANPQSFKCDCKGSTFFAYVQEKVEKKVSVFQVFTLFTFSFSRFAERPSDVH
jgi:hypothetical protein